VGRKERKGLERKEVERKERKGLERRRRNKFVLWAENSINIKLY